jgi:class 3 adenylate cyclase
MVSYPLNKSLPYNSRSSALSYIRAAAIYFTRRVITSLGRLRRLRLRTVLVVPFLIPIIVSTGLVGWLSFRNGQRAINDLAFQLQSETTSRVRQYLDVYLATPHQLNQINLDAWQLGLLDLTNFDRLGQYFFKQMKVFDVGYVNFGDPKGEFIGVERLDNGQLLINEVTARSGPGKLNIFETNDEGDRIRLLEVKEYDHRLEAWYAEPIKLGKSMWTSIYQWEDKPDIMSISSSYLVRGKDNEIIGVIGVDLILSQIGSFLGKLKIGESGKAFILERDGFLVANSGSSKPTQVVNGQASRVKGWESADAVIRATSQQLIEEYPDLRQIGDGRQFSFDIDDQRQLVNVTPWRDPLGLDWLTVVVVPEGDFMTQINANTHITILLCLFTFVAATAIGVLTARWISGQIGKLNTAARGIANGDLNQHVEMGGVVSIVEIEDLAGSFNSMAEGLRMRNWIRETFGRYVGRRVAEQLIESRDLLTESGDRREVAVMFCDLAGFATLSERVEAERLVKFLNAYFSLIAREIAATDGIIDKYVGDAVMAYWCPPFVPPDQVALRSADAALLCLAQMPALTSASYEIFDGGAQAYGPRFRIGIASGQSIAGSIGAEKRRNYTVIGDTVNLASRLERANRLYRTTNLVCGKTANAVRANFELREIDTVLLPGIDTPQAIFEIVGRTGQISADKQELRARYALALDAYRRGDLPFARRHFSDCLALSPEDGPTRTMLDRIETLTAMPAMAGNWYRVWRLTKGDLP